MTRRPYARSEFVAPLSVVFLLGLALSNIVTAELPRPKLFSIHPSGGQIGKSIDVELGGERIDRVTQLAFSAAGPQATRIGPGKFRIATPAGFRPQVVDVVGFGSEGATNPRGFAIGALPVVADKEPNDLREQAQPVPLDAAIHGRMDVRADVDYFRIVVPREQRVTVHVKAVTLDSKLVPAVSIFDDAGRPVDRTRDYSDVDTPIVLGPYPSERALAIRLHDLVYGGGVEYWYRMEISTGPFVWFAWPPAVEVGKPWSLSVIGWNLPGGVPIDGLPSNGLSQARWLELKKRGCAIAPLSMADARVTPLPGSHFVPPSMAVGDNIVVRPKDPRLPDLLCGAARQPISFEKEPNDEPSTAQPLPWPCEVVGGFDSTADRDWYRISVKKGQRVELTGICARAGLLGDLVLKVQRVVGADGKGNPKTDRHAEYDDQSNSPAGPKFSTASSDPATAFTADGDADYLVEVADRYGLHSPRSVYRLRIAADRSNGHTFVLPFDENGPTGLTVNPGGRALVRTLVVRGLDQDAAIRRVVDWNRSEGGIQLGGPSLPAGAAEAAAVLTAPANSKVGVVDLFRPGASATGAAPANWALGTILWPAAQRQNRPARLARAPLAGIASPSAPYRLSAVEQHVAAQGSRVKIALKLERLAKEFVGPLGDIKPILPPANFDATPAAIGDKQNETTMELHVKGNVAPGEYSFPVAGVAQVPWPQNVDDPKSAKTPVPVSDPSNLIRVRVLPAPVAIKLDKHTFEAKAGGAVAVGVRIVRHTKPAMAVRVELTLPPGLADIAAAPIDLPADKSEARLTIQIGAKVAPGDKPNLSIRASTIVDGIVLPVDEIVTLKVLK